LREGVCSIGGYATKRPGFVIPLMSSKSRAGVLFLIIWLFSINTHAVGIKVQILSFNDFHGNIEPPKGSAKMLLTEDPSQQKLGGSEYLSTTLSKLRKGVRYSITASAGDVIGASPLLSGLFHDEPTVDVMEALKLDVSSVGNHEFDEGLTELLRIQYGGCHPVDGCYFPDSPYDGAKFPYLAANVIYDSTNQAILPKTWIKKVDNVNVGFIGMTLTGTPLLVPRKGIQGITFQDEVKAAIDAVNELYKNQVRIIVLLIHEGGHQSGTYNGCEGISGPIVALASKLPAEIDLIIAGHTHESYICKLPDPNGRMRYVTSASAYGRVVTETWLTINPLTGKVERNQTKAQNHLVTRTSLPDPAITAVIKKWKPLATGLGAKAVGTITADINRSPKRDTPASLENLIADAMIARTKVAPYNAQIALMNAGAVRTSLSWIPASGDKPAGLVTFADVYGVIPWGNTILTMTLTGDQIRQALDAQNSESDSNSRIYGVSNGLTFDYSAAAAKGSRVQNLMLNGQPLDLAKGYRVTISAYMKEMGVFKDGKNSMEAGTDLNALIAYFHANSPVTPPPADRIRLIRP
jgi:2',3'-cyclic-nucleotide 2'-phosphodiesterase (5'-nucleotidase family)